MYFGVDAVVSSDYNLEKFKYQSHMLMRTANVKHRNKLCIQSGVTRC